MSAPPRPAVPGWLAALALAAFVLAAFSDALLPAHALFERDVHAYWYPQRAALRAALAEGQLPLWNPWVGFGAPFLADASAQLAYPPNWLVLPLPLPLQFTLLTLGHALVAAAGASLLARLVVGGTLPALVAGVTFALAGPVLSAASLYHHYAGAALLPWVLWALERLLARPAGERALALAALAAAQLLAGSGDLVLMTALLALGRLALELREASPRRLLGAARPLALAALVALSLSAVQWLPTAERGLSGLRAAQSFRTRTYWSLHPASLVDLAVPRFVSDAPLDASARAQLYEGREPLFSCLYLGVASLALVAVGLVLRQPRAAPLGAGFAAFVLLSLGRHTPLYALLLQLPGFSLLRYPQKYLLPASLCLALAAAAGTAGLVRGLGDGERRRVQRLAGALVAVGLLAALAAPWTASVAFGAQAAIKLGRSALLLALVGLLLAQRAKAVLPRPAPVLALVALGALDLILVGRGTNPTAPASLYRHRPEVLERLGDVAGRVHAATESSACLAPGAGPAGWQPSWVAALGFIDTLRPPMGIRWGLRGSYDGEFTGLGPRFSEAFAAMVQADVGTPAALRLLQLGGVERVLYLGRAAPALLRPIATLATPCACPLQLVGVPDPLPPAFVVGRELAEPEDALAAVLSPAFDPRRDVLLAGASSRPTGPSRGSARVVERKPDTLRVEALLEQPGVLVVTEAFDEGWTASVAGRELEVLRANGLFRAVRLAAGRHEVVFRYRPWAVRAGAAASLTALLAAAGWALAVWRGERF